MADNTITMFALTAILIVALAISTILTTRKLIYAPLVLANIAGIGLILNSFIGEVLKGADTTPAIQTLLHILPWVLCSVLLIGSAIPITKAHTKESNKEDPKKTPYQWDFNPTHCPSCGGPLKPMFMIHTMVECEDCKTGFLREEINYMAKNRTKSIEGLHSQKNNNSPC